MANRTKRRGRGPAKGSGGRPKNEVPTVQVSMRLPPDIAKWFKDNKDRLITMAEADLATKSTLD